METTYKCPIKGHDHNLEQISSHKNPDGVRAITWGCPFGSYRWFAVADRPQVGWLRMKRPRWGWKR